MRTQAVHSDLVTASESTIITCIWQRLKAGEWESFMVDKREVFGNALISDCRSGVVRGGLTTTGYIM